MEWQNTSIRSYNIYIAHSIELGLWPLTFKCKRSLKCYAKKSRTTYARTNPIWIYKIVESIELSIQAHTHRHTIKPQALILNALVMLVLLLMLLLLLLLRLRLLLCWWWWWWCFTYIWDAYGKIDHVRYFQKRNIKEKKTERNSHTHTCIFINILIDSHEAYIRTRMWLTTKNRNDQTNEL